MKLIAGLGNPGDKYYRTRHNIGFMVIDEFARSLEIELKPENDLWDGALVKINGTEVYLMKPMTYMNRSGEAVGEFFDYNEIGMEDILVITDDFNLPLGTIRVRPKGSDGGHNGIADISFCLQTEEFPRMRIGIGKGDLTKDEYVDFVLNNFSDDEYKIINELMPVYTDCIRAFVTEPILNVMNSFNKSHFNS